MRCLRPIYLCMVEFVLLDCGKPVVGPDAVLRIPNAIQMSYTQNYEEGDTIQLNDGKGRPCIDEQACSYLADVDWTLENCGLTPTQTAWLSGDRVVDDAPGAVFGRREDCSPIFAMRAWQELAGVGGRKVCNDAGEPEHVVHHFACVTDIRFDGAVTLGANDSTRATITGRSIQNGGTFLQGPWADWAEPWTDEEIHGYQIQAGELPEVADDCALMPYVAPAPARQLVGAAAGGGDDS